MANSLRTAILAILTTLSFASAANAGDPYTNLRWFLQDTIAVSLIGPETYKDLRSQDLFEMEDELRDRATPSAVWVARRAIIEKAVINTGCDAFETRTFADWQATWRMTTQWREVFHGVSVKSDHWLGLSGIRRIHLAAAVVSSGLPESAFVPNDSGSLRAELFETAATRKGTGFNRMHDAISHLNMTLTRTESCEGFELYIWDFSP